MVESFGIDSIISYLKNVIPDTSQIINPAYKALDHQHRKISATLYKLKVRFAEISLQDKELSEKEMNKYIQKKSDCQQQIKDMENEKAAIIEKEIHRQKNIIQRFRRKSEI